MRPFFPLLARRRGLLLLGCLVVLGLGTGCETEEAPADYVARVGNDHLTETDLNRMLTGMGPARDTSRARQQIVDQWVTRTLLYQEAQRLNLASVDAVQRKLERQRRSTLIAAMKNRLHREANLAPTPQEVRTYFERHKERLKLREPYVAVRYLSTPDRAAARAARQDLRTLATEADSTWRRLVRTHAADTARAYRFSQHYLPERQLRTRLPFLTDTLDGLEAGDTAPIVTANEKYHVLRLDRRRPTGSAPELSWFKPEIRRRLQIRARKQMYRHKVQRLRSKAQADGALETP
jgi:hypothetical protein